MHNGCKLISRKEIQRSVTDANLLIELEEKALASRFVFESLVKTYFEFPSIWQERLQGAEVEKNVYNTLFDTDDWKAVVKQQGFPNMDIPAFNLEYWNIAYLQLNDNVDL